MYIKKKSKKKRGFIYLKNLLIIFLSKHKSNYHQTVMRLLIFIKLDLLDNFDKQQQ